VSKASLVLTITTAVEVRPLTINRRPAGPWQAIDDDGSFALTGAPFYEVRVGASCGGKPIGACGFIVNDRGERA